jgi:hypothetical protein
MISRSATPTQGFILMRTQILAGLLPLALAGCSAAGAITSVVTAPVRVAGKAADLATTSQSEADQKRGREIRHREERLGALMREYRRQSEKCAAGDVQACSKRDIANAEMRALMPSVPYESS